MAIWHGLYFTERDTSAILMPFLMLELQTVSEGISTQRIHSAIASAPDPIPGTTAHLTIELLRDKTILSNIRKFHPSKTYTASK
jgi:hypothetical protein